MHDVESNFWQIEFIGQVHNFSPLFIAGANYILRFYFYFPF